jgi:solute carrier family 9 (sodium/hydrogen exchanger), member 8
VLLVLSLSFALWTSRGLSGTVQDCPDCNCGATAADALPRSEHGAEALLGLGLSVFSATLALCILASYAMMQWRFSFIPDCIAYVLLGAAVGTAIRVFGSSATLSMSLPNEEQFFIFILPPIMFEAGYSLSKRDFFKEAGSICMFAIPGTMISAVVFGIGIYCTGMLGASYTFSLWEAMTFGALLSAVDPVATIAVFSALKVNKPLHFLVFGESVLNDAVAIVLYRTFSKLIGSASTVWWVVVADFFRIFVGSAVIGALSAVCASLVLKHTSLYRTPSLEMSFFLLMAYFPYFLCDGLHMSGIMGILANGVVLAHYAHHNLSKITQISAQQSFRTLSFLAETFVFVFLGSALTTFDHSWHGLTVMWGIILTLVSRFANIYPLSRLVNRWRVQKISNKNQLIMWFSGLRGAVAFALSLNFPSSNGSDETRRAVISTTLAIVLFTVIVLGGGIMPLLRLLRVESAEDEASAAAAEATGNSSAELGRRGGSSRGNGGSGARIGDDGSGGLSQKLQQLDDEVLKPWLLAASTRSMAATNRTLQTLAVAENEHLTPHQLGQVLESTAATVLPAPSVGDAFERIAVDASAGVGFEGYEDAGGEGTGSAEVDPEDRGDSDKTRLLR